MIRRADEPAPLRGPRRKRVAQRRLAFALYACFLTALLFAAGNPLKMVGAPNEWMRIYRIFEPAAHFLFFMPLAMLALSARLPIHGGTLAVILVTYAFGTELAQELIPNRSTETADFVQDLVGLSVGAALWVTLHYMWGRWRGIPRESWFASPPEPDLAALRWRRP